MVLILVGFVDLAAYGDGGTNLWQRGVWAKAQPKLKLIITMLSFLIDPFG